MLGETAGQATRQATRQLAINEAEKKLKANKGGNKLLRHDLTMGTQFVTQCSSTLHEAWSQE